MAVTLSLTELLGRLGVTDPSDQARYLIVAETAAALVNDYAPDAPPALSNEAAIRFAGYLYGSDYGPVRSETIGPQAVEYVTNHAAMFRNCGAAALLTRYRRRRAGSIG